jgi:hypothetical protein
MPSPNPSPEQPVTVERLREIARRREPSFGAGYSQRDWDEAAERLSRLVRLLYRLRLREFRQRTEGLAGTIT